MSLALPSPIPAFVFTVHPHQQWGFRYDAWVVSRVSLAGLGSEKRSRSGTAIMKVHRHNAVQHGGFMARIFCLVLVHFPL